MPSPRTRLFPTAQDAETAFYEALERAALKAMMEVWAEDDEIVCVHPSGQRLTGQAQVREGWKQMFAGGAGLRVQASHQVVASSMMAEVRSVHENITVPGERRARPPIVATNVYFRTAAGWRMVAHHASPSAAAPADAATPPAPPAAPQTLH